MFRRAGIKTDSFILQKRDRDYHGGEITLLILTVVYGTFAPVGTAPTTRTRLMLTPLCSLFPANSILMG